MLVWTAASAQSLRDLYVSGLTADPQIAASEADLMASRERLREARAGLLPQLAVSASSSTGEFRPENDGPEQDFHTDRWSLQLTQTLYAAEPLADLAIARARLVAEETRLEVITADLAARLTSTYFELLGAREDLQALKLEHAAAQLQMEAARGQYEKGSVAITEALDAEARFDVVGARMSAATYEMRLKREAFRQLIGELDFELLVLPREAPAPELPERPLEQLILEALERNPAVRQARLQSEAARSTIRQARAAYFPTLDVSLNYGSDTATPTPSNPAAVRGETLQAQATLRVPLFAGFRNAARVGAARADFDKALTEVEQAQRQVATEVREAYFGLRAALNQMRSQRTAERSTATAARAQRKGYVVGTSTTAEVLEAESLYANARRDLMKARLDAHLNRIRLQIALGRPWRERIDALSRLMVPQSQEPEPSLQAATAREEPMRAGTMTASR